LNGRSQSRQESSGPLIEHTAHRRWAAAAGWQLVAMRSCAPLFCAAFFFAMMFFAAVLCAAPRRAQAEEIAAPAADHAAPLVDPDPTAIQSPPPLAIPELAAAVKLDRSGSCDCVDVYYRAAMRAWQCLAEESSPDVSDGAVDAVLQAYQESLAGLIGAGIRYGRLDPGGRLTVDDGNGPIAIPFAYHGLAWRAEDFCKLLPASRYRSKDVVHHYAAPGLGLPLIAVRLAPPDEPYTLPKQPFAVTALLRPTCSLPAGNRDATPTRRQKATGPTTRRGRRPCLNSTIRTFAHPSSCTAAGFPWPAT